MTEQRMTDRLHFPQGFVWGSATAAYQIEGAARVDGRLPSIWDVFCQAPGKVHDGETGDVACDHYHRMPEDLDLMAALGLPSYRFSVSWPRVIPGGAGPVNTAGLDFYQRLVDGLLERAITPLLTLYHWDLPQALQLQGGWANRDTVGRFADYAEVIGRALGDRVPTITTLNEPWCTAFLGHSSGVHAPGVTDNATALTVAHHLNLAHGRAVSVLRGVTPASTRLSVTLNLAQVLPASDSPEDLAAAEHVDAIANRVFLDPMLRGSYPPALLRDTSHITDWSFVADGDLAEINAGIDVLGVNFYAPSKVAAPSAQIRAEVTGRWVNDPHQSEAGPSPWPGTDLAYSVPQPGPYTAMGWPIVPEAFTDLLLRVHRDYPETPMAVTENGAAFDDVLTGDGQVHDLDRIDYVRRHLAAVHAAIEGGADVRGYYLWSFLDNFEWAWGYSKRFGMVHVDYDSQARTPKDSALWFSDVIKNNAVQPL
ncbi:MAG TPA: beta-glucosidase [Jatrophihabitans sp.]|jgi:beta-glucosidase|uniref:glycoside hydrolase family 1 protein n=1 Tax=Jatrophihabitans sp. TaxID=1932789 RepID=UPI002F165C5E